MWCDNCLLLFPLRGGAIALALFIAAYNLAGSIFLFNKGLLLFAVFPEAQIYGGIGMASMSICIIAILAFSNNSFMFTRLVFFVYPILLIVLDVRAGVMVFRLNGAKDVIAWECRNNGALYNTTLADATYEDIQAAQAIIGNTLTLPKSFCNLGVHSLYLAFAFSLAVDIGLQIYLYFMTWRFMARLKKYYAFSQTGNGLYTAG